MSKLTIKDVCKDSQILESIGNALLSSYIEEIEKMDTLIVGCSNYVNFFFSKKRLLDFRFLITTALTGRENVKKSYLKRMTDEQLNETLTKIDKLLKDYEEYLQEKREIKQLRKASRNNP